MLAAINHSTYNQTRTLTRSWNLKSKKLRIYIQLVLGILWAVSKDFQDYDLNISTFHTYKWIEICICYQMHLITKGDIWCLNVAIT